LSLESMAIPKFSCSETSLVTSERSLKTRFMTLKSHC
jgi:hypothetical protein